MHQNKVHFTIAEEEWIDHLREMGMKTLEAQEVVIGYKREMAFMHKQQGNDALFKHLMKEIGEWHDNMEDLESVHNKDKKLILPEGLK